MAWKNKSKEYMREYHRKWYHKNKERIKNRKSKSSKKRRNKILDFIKSLKEVPCKDCGNSYPYYVMDFDHVIGNKRFTIGQNKTLSIETLKQEIKKCEIVCANCHRIRTFNRK